MNSINPNSPNHIFPPFSPLMTFRSLHELIADPQASLEEIEAAIKPSSIDEVRDSDTPLSLALRQINGEIDARYLLHIIDVISLLIDMGADVNAKNAEGNTPLMQASESGFTQIVALLLNTKGIQVDAANAFNNTALCLATYKGHVDIVRLLIDNGIDASKNTALRMAAHNGHVDIVCLLIDNGADVNAKGKAEATPLHVACTEGHFKVVEVLLDRGAHIEAYSSFYSTPLNCACANGHVDIVCLLIDKGANIHAVKVSDTTALHIACAKGHFNVVKELLNRGAHIEAKTVFGSTPLHLACEQGSFSVVKELLNRGANIHALKNDGTTLLFVACAQGHLDIVEELIKRGACVNAMSDEGWTPLIVAARGKNAQMVRCLLNSKDIQINKTKDRKGTALEHAADKGRLEIVQLLVEADPNTLTSASGAALLRAARKGHSNVIDWLIQKGADIETEADDQSKPLHFAAEYGHHEAVALLIDRGANMNAKDMFGQTALHKACQKGHLKVVKALIDAGADLSIKSNKGIVFHQINMPSPESEKGLYALLVEMQQKGLERAAAFLGITSSSVPVSTEKKQLQMVLRNQSVLMKGYETTSYSSSFFEATELFTRIILSPQFLDYLNAERTQILALAEAKNDQFLDEVNRFEFFLAECRFFYRALFQPNYLNTFLKPFFMPLESELRLRREKYISQRASASVDFERLKAQFDAGEIFGILSSWGVGVSGKTADGLDHNAKNSYRLLLGILDPKEIWSCHIETGEDLRKIGINKDITLCIECLGHEKDQESGLWKQLNDEIFKKTQEWTGIPELKQPLDTLNRIFFGIRDLSEMPEDPKDLFSSLRGAIRTVEETMGKFGVNTELTQCIDSLVQGRNRKEALWQGLKDELSKRIGELEKVSIDLQGPLAALTQVRDEIAGLPEMPSDPREIFSSLREAVRTASLELLKYHLASFAAKPPEAMDLS